MSTKSLKPARGRLLLAEPFLGDPNFNRSVILLLEHSAEGSLGFVLNNPLVGIQLNDLTIDWPDFKSTIFEGGPVQKDSLFFLHNKGDLIPGSKEIMPGIYWGGDVEPLKNLIEVGLIKENDIRFFLGYSGWAEQQLEEELSQNSWIVTELGQINIFAANVAELWQRILRQGDDTQRLWANSPVNPQLN